jgi:oligoribonuclease
MSNTPAEQLVWIDCEMTGLDVEHDGLVEIAVIITDFDLKPLDPGFQLVINPGPKALEHMNDFVRNMHETSGLIDLITNGVTLEEAEEQVLTYVNRFVTEGRRPLLAGNTIGMDRRFITRYMPTLDERLHYRSVDVSTLKELARRWHPKAFFHAPDKNGGHRALADIAESIQELAYFRAATLIDSPGPASPQAGEISAVTIKRFAAIVAAAHSPA